jgi:hypothetical protein
MTTPTNSPAAESLADSPWFWAYVFACGGLVALMLMGPKYQARQVQIDENTEKRIQASNAWARQSGQAPPQADQAESPAVDSSSRDISSTTADRKPAFSLRPLYATMFVVLTLAMVRFSRRRSAKSKDSQP